ncbi:MAG TPA: hypothetical protein VK573_08375 [Gemmatimonadales bacterium]|nr:hypothetical protein [Gemmatimonadales bacterium]
MLFASGTLTVSVTLQQAVAHGCMGLRTLNGLTTSTPGHLVVYANESLNTVRLRWRATNPGTRSATRFTRNWTTETS